MPENHIESNIAFHLQIFSKNVIDKNILQIRRRKKFCLLSLSFQEVSHEYFPEIKGWENKIK